MVSANLLYREVKNDRISFFTVWLPGFLFGFFLQRGQVLRYDKQIGALRLMDMTILKFMLTAIFVGSVGIYLLKDLGLVKAVHQESSTNRSGEPRLSVA
jgi:hypothetical protein